MDKSKLEILDISPSQVQAGSFTLVLGEENGDLRLPIIIGMFEAQAIAIELENIKSKRPLTHDLFTSFAHSFDYTVEEVLITDIDEGVFFAKIICSDGIRQKNIDARPSDAIAIALRFKAPIYCVQKVLDNAGVSTSDLVGDTEKEEKPSKKVSVKVSGGKSERPLSEISITELKKMLDAALESEEYEQAAKIRDEIESRN
ncbi:bifunctional nuclease domain-containing protein [Jiulongibacter sp. NS-SX5]|uniref:bifunctional nuclease domain-containing protein n=1 Tax=Jiulongibacter sp. NS-SX5 TaxID=3463854 RepID=UPI00405A3BD4